MSKSIQQIEREHVKLIRDIRECLAAGRLIDRNRVLIERMAALGWGNDPDEGDELVTLYRSYKARGFRPR